MKRIVSVVVLVVITPLIVLGVLLNGCGPGTDVTSSPKYSFQSFARTVWKTKVKVGLVQNKNYRGYQRIALVTSDFYDPKDPRYIVPSPSQKVITILPVGTRIRIEQLMQDNGTWGGLEVFVSLVDQATEEKLILLPDFFLTPNDHLHTGKAKEWDVNPDLLEKAE